MALFFVVSHSDVFSMTSEEFEKCILSKAEEAGGSDFLRTVDAAFKDAYAVQATAIQGSVSSELGATLNGYTAPSITKTKTKDGGDATTIHISLPKFNPKEWLKPETKRKKILEVCGQYFQDLAEFCANAYEKKEENINQWLALHKGKIDEMTRRMVANPQATAEELTGGYDFRTDDVTRGNMRLANIAFLPPIDIDPASVYDSPAGRLVTDKNNIPVGLMMNVSVDGKRERYFAPSVGGGLLTNPYYFVFGGVPSSTWNRYWEQKYGQLKVNGQPLSSL